MGNNFSHFWEQDLKAVEDFVGGLGSGISSTLTGLTGGGWDYGNTGRDFKNYKNDIFNAFTGQNNRIGVPTNIQAENLKNYNRAINPRAPWNASNWATYLGNSNAVNFSNYSGGNAIGNITPPSDLSKISDPVTKIANSVARGNQKQLLNVIASNNNHQFINSSPSLAIS